MSSLGRALSASRLSRPEAFQAQTGIDPEVLVLVIYTGGTIGMTKQHGLVPKANALVKYLRTLPILHDEQYAQDSKLYERYPDKPLVLPQSEKQTRIVYTVLEYNPLLDSSNMTPSDWAKIGKDIKKYYTQYFGFVVLHGTDTMAFTSSVLSFMCENLGKSVILTGSQIPIYELRNDGRDNLLGALLIAGQFIIPEVCLFFHQKLYRGNRVTKVDAASFEAYASPNLPPLADAEITIKINWDTVLKPKPTDKFTVHTELNCNVGVLRLFPGITAETVKAFLQPLDGMILETYGCGNAPDKNTDLLAVIKNATDRGVIIINCTQCLRGSVEMTYETGRALCNAGVITGRDMTPEAALTKLSYVLAKKDLSIEDKKKIMSTNLRGEMKADISGAELCLSDSRFIKVIAKSLHSSCKEELEAIRDALTPTLACAAAKVGDIEALEAIREMGSDLSGADYDGRTPLHVAACEGRLEVVKHLLSKGATVYARDRFGDTPLHGAVSFRHKEVVKELRRTGAHFSQDEMVAAGIKLRSLGKGDDLEGLEIWKLAGVDLTKPDHGQTPTKVNGGFVKFTACPRS